MTQKKNTVTKTSHMVYSPLRKSMLGFDSKNHFVSAFSCQKHKLWNAVLFYPSLLCLCQKTHRQIPLPHFDNMPSLGAWCPLLLMLLSGEFNLVLCALKIVYTSVCVWDEYAHTCITHYFSGEGDCRFIKKAMTPTEVLIFTVLLYVCYL